MIETMIYLRQSSLSLQLICWPC